MAIIIEISIGVLIVDGIRIVNGIANAVWKVVRITVDAKYIFVKGNPKKPVKLKSFIQFLISFDGFGETKASLRHWFPKKIEFHAP
ncbi:hypothetical protein GQ43DRAFT_482548 [Delitschia confertaspora ATCC 74209]|uniref:Uncharacterized protein n=1 Tax=Delitschia confertaspora ATCC 74209 TaxID=1513339 RepID=A0A9P4MQG3_9PLEO|nr:hypothetical protein GQ43DRAFT_482548 [Delitschia confertaspora ATCC 74209]